MPSKNIQESRKSTEEVTYLQDHDEEELKDDVKKHSNVIYRIISFINIILCLLILYSLFSMFFEKSADAASVNVHTDELSNPGTKNLEATEPMSSEVDGKTKPSRLALFIMWNNKINETVRDEMNTIYGPYFRYLRHIGGDAPCNVFDGKSNKGMVMYGCYAQALIDAKMDGDLSEVEGVWFISDDTALKFWKLEEITFQRGSKNCYISYGIDSLEDRPKWPNWHRTLDSIQTPIGVKPLQIYLQNPSSFRDDLYKSLNCARAPEECLQKATSTHGNSDSLYLPNTPVIDKFIEYAKLFSRENARLVFTHIITPLLAIAACPSVLKIDDIATWIWRYDISPSEALDLLITHDEQLMTHPMDLSNGELFEKWKLWVDMLSDDKNI